MCYSVAWLHGTLGGGQLLIAKMYYNMLLLFLRRKTIHCVTELQSQSMFSLIVKTDRQFNLKVHRKEIKTFVYGVIREIP